jgi:hypothetical protein
MSSLSHLRASVIKSRTRLIYISFWYGKLEEIFYIVLMPLVLQKENMGRKARDVMSSIT